MKTPRMKTIQLILCFISIFILFLSLSAQADFNSFIKKTGEAVDKGVSDLNDSVDRALGDDKKESEKSDEAKPGEVDPDELARTTDKQLRDAQNEMFKGHNDIAIAELKKAAASIKEIESADPNHKKLSSLKSKQDKLKKDLERKTGKTINLYGEDPVEEAKTDTAKSTSDTASAKSKSSTSAEKLPYAARQKMSKLNNELRSIDSSMDWVKKYEDMGESAEKQNKKLDEAEERIQAAQSTLDEAKSEAAKEGVTSHPDFDEAEATIKEKSTRLAELRKEVEERGAKMAASAAEVDADVEKFVNLVTELYDKYFSKATGTAVYANDIEPVKKQLALLDDFDQNHRAQAQKALEEFGAKYGTTYDEIKKNVQAAGYEGQLQPQFKYEELSEGLANIKKSRTAEYDAIIKRVDSIIANLPNLHDFFRLKQHEAIREWMALSLKFADDSAQAQAKVKEVDEKLDADKGAFKEKVAKRNWAGNSSGDVAKGAMTFFENDAEWSKKYKILGVHIKGDWSVQKRNLVGNPIMYGQACEVAVQTPDDKTEGLARVFDVTMRTLESAKPEMKPPFTSITVGDSWFVKADKVK